MTCPSDHPDRRPGPSADPSQPETTRPEPTWLTSVAPNDTTPESLADPAAADLPDPLLRHPASNRTPDFDHPEVNTKPSPALHGFDARWALLAMLSRHRVGSAKRALVLGCQAAMAPARLAHAGYRVTAMDRSPERLQRAREMADRNGLGQACQFQAITQRQLHLPHALFDAAAVLSLEALKPCEEQNAGGAGSDPEGSTSHEAAPSHHHDLIAEVMRVTRPHAMIAILVDDAHEAMLSDAIEASFGDVQARAFTLRDRLDSALAHRHPALHRSIQRIDEHLRQSCPGVSERTGVKLLTTRRPRPMKAKRRAA